ncbi:MAG TPA: amidohydrolase family protein [Bacteroidota bacterium]|nr:amidohydrolase family protein [Bacteroidota bacterium]
MDSFSQRRLLAVFLTLTFTSLLVAQPAVPKDTAKKSEPKWDVSSQHGPSTEIQFETSEGTWMAVDVSPDGKQIVFDLLGDIYLMPLSGGEAKALTSGPAYDVQPRFSPDGSRISFTSDRDGIDNLWIMNSDGSMLSQVSKEKERQVNNAVWTPDGQYLIGRKHYRNTRSLGAGEMWLFHTTGGAGLQLTKRRNWQQDAGEPCLSPDGRYLYWSEDVTPSGFFEYNKDPYGTIYAIQRLDRETGKTESFIRENGGSARPQISRNGKTLAFVRRVGLNTVLYLYDLESGKETELFTGLDHDQQEAWAVFGIYPGFSWTPDGRNIVIWAKGKIWNIDVRTKEAREIPFRATVKQTIAEAVRFPQEVSPDQFDLKMLRWVTVSPDQKSVLYNALGKLWIRALPAGTPARLTKDEKNLELYPSFSPDGKWIVYATWNDDEMGALYKVQPNGRNQGKLTPEKGTYIEASFSKDGKHIVYRKTGGDGLRGNLYSKNRGIYWIPAEGGKPTLITEEGSSPLFAKSGDRIFVTAGESGKTALISVGLSGENRRVHLLSDNAQEIVPSPDEEWVALVERYNGYVAVFPKTGQAVTIGPSTNDYPVKRVTRDAATNMHWSADSKKLFWSLGPELYTRDLTNTFSFVRDAKDSVQEKPDTAGLNISFRTQSGKPTGVIALVGGTVISMKGDEVISNATIVIDQNRIKAIGPSAAISIPTDAKRVDVAGSTIMPGIIDVHAHANSGDWSPLTNWPYYVNLAYGVTTMHDPSAITEYVFSNSEMIKAGVMVGPRVYSTGTILYGAEGSYKAIVNNFDDAMSHLRRLKAVGAFSVKSYNQPRRDQRQQIIEAARNLKMLVVPEGGSTFFWNMTMVLDGHTGVEHNIPIAPVYKDVVELVSRSRTGLTPTLIVNYAGLSGEYYWYKHYNVWENKRLLTFTPRSGIDARSRRRQMASDDDYHYIETSKSLKRVLDAGGKVQLGAHGQLQGLGAHWELWMLQQGGMTNHEALRCATLSGAQYLGLDRDLGSLEPGKLADLIVLDKNPLESIRNSDSVKYVMINGRLFDASTMNEIGNHPQERPTFYWER